MKQNAQETKHIWEFLGYWANCTIFIMAGYNIGKAVGNNADTDSHLATFVCGLFLYPLSLSVRAIFMGEYLQCTQDYSHSGVFYFTQQIAGRASEVTDYMCYTWGGLRGALPLLLSLHLFDIATKHKHEYPDGNKIDFHQSIFQCATVYSLHRAPGELGQSHTGACQRRCCDVTVATGSHVRDTCHESGHESETV